MIPKILRDLLLEENIYNHNTMNMNMKKRENDYLVMMKD